MFVAIEHDIQDAMKFRQRAEKAFPLPDGLHVHLFLPASDLSHATCLYEASSVDQVRDFVDGLLGDSSRNRYFGIAEEHAVGLPRRQPA